MQSHLVVLALAGLASALTPTQVKDDLDTHPWRPAPTAAVAKTPAVAAVREPVKPVVPNAPAPVATSTPSSPIASTGAWQLQLAALSSIDAAKADQKRLEKIVGVGKVEILSEGSVHRLRYGSYATKEAAEVAREELRTKSVEGFPVKKN